MLVGACVAGVTVRTLHRELFLNVLEVISMLRVDLRACGSERHVGVYEVFAAGV